MEFGCIVCRHSIKTECVTVDCDKRKARKKIMKEQK